MKVIRGALAAAIVAAAVLSAPAAAQAGVPRRPSPQFCTETLVYEHAGTDHTGPFIDRAYERNCGTGTCTLYYTSRDGGLTWALVWTDCPATATTPTPRR